MRITGTRCVDYPIVSMVESLVPRVSGFPSNRDIDAGSVAKARVAEVSLVSTEEPDHGESVETAFCQTRRAIEAVSTHNIGPVSLREVARGCRYLTRPGNLAETSRHHLSVAEAWTEDPERWKAPGVAFCCTGYRERREPMHC